MRRLVMTACCFLILLPVLGEAQVTVVQSRGVDSRVDYAALAELGPWDDRNYQLNQDDIELMADNEAELGVRIPVFFRVQLRREFPNMRGTGPVQYPRSAYPRFLLHHQGYLVDGQIYRNLRREGDRVVVDLAKPWSPPENDPGKALTGDVRVSSPVGGAESAVAFNPADSNRVIAGSNGPIDPQTMHYSSDGGSTWQVAGSLPQGNTCCDPTVGWSADGSKAYASTLEWTGSSRVLFYRSGDHGQTWTDLVNEPGADSRREFGSGTDKEYLHVDVHGASPCTDNIYVTWHEGGVMKFTHSTDMAHTWATVQTHSGSGEWGIGSDITSDTAGNVYHFWPTYSSQSILMRKSVAPSCGASFQSVMTVASTQAAYDFPIPSMDTRRAFVYVSAGADLGSGSYGGSVYAAWTDSTAPTGETPANNHARIQVAYSRNAGTSWTVTTPHETADAGTVDRWHPWLAVGPDGTVHVVFYDTRNDPSRTSVDLYWSTSADGAQTWSTPQRLTSEISPKIDDGFEFGDYNGLDVVMNDLIAIFTDNRNEGGGGTDSVDIYAAGAQVGSSLIFEDGFESGSASAWTAVVP